MERNSKSLDQALTALEASLPFAKSNYQTRLFGVADTLLESDEGLSCLSAQAHRLEAAGAFDGGGWADPAKLLPPLVRGALVAGGVLPVIEALSELRMLAIAQGRQTSPRVSPAEARDFLEEVLALNLDLLFPRATEASRTIPAAQKAKAERLFRFLGAELGLQNLVHVVEAEIQAVCVQRPIMTRQARRMIRLMEEIPSEEQRSPALHQYARAVRGAGELAQRHRSLADYRSALLEADEAALRAEAQASAENLRATGLGSRHHSVLLRVLRTKAPRLIASALQLSAVGQAELESNEELAHQLIKVAILPASPQAVYGLARLLDRGLLSHKDVAAGLRRLVDLDLCAKVRRGLLRRRSHSDGVTANSLLVAGALSVLGQPLGIGQGNNPTCQAVRGISLWSQHAPGYLLELVASAARDDLVQIRFEGEVLSSQDLDGGLARDHFDDELDPISMILVRHLDRLYDEMMRRVASRDDDGHKWANPGLYGRWVPHGFAALLDKSTGAVAGYEDFVRRFYATHHPAYNDGYELIYTNPVGIFVTTAHGDLLGLHAVGLQRVATDPDGTLRAYFFNPNNDGRQDWGQGIKPSITGHGEEEGESSLPFHQFTARLYAFHYNPYEEGDGYAVPKERIRVIEELARASWGKSYVWSKGPL
ncbi:MAG: hypothetical protein KDD82_00215 [Planctomycetes bacterium]|nr:hypothetical protein [Planctomycetota bacterium]